MSRGRRLWALAVVLVVAGGCSTIELPPPVYVRADATPEALIAADTPDDQAAALDDPFALSDETRRWLQAQMHTGQTQRQRLAALVEIFGPEGPLALDYDLIASQTAEETLASGQGNCLSFTILFVALARELNLEADVHEVPIPASWSRVGSTAVSNRHVIAAGKVGNSHYEVDFGHLVELGVTPSERLDDRQVAAILESNRGAAALANGRSEEGLRHLRRAARIDPALGQTWVNIGAALVRRDDRAGAELAFRTGAARSPGDPAALSGLLRLYRETGADEAARLLESRMPALLGRNPYYLYAEGLREEREGHGEAALAFYRRALRYQPDDPWFHMAVIRNRLQAQDRQGTVTALQRALAEMGDDDRLRYLLGRKFGAEVIDGKAPARPEPPPELSRRHERDHEQDHERGYGATRLYGGLEL
ncbi:MAG TPA: hypothetical protein VLA56_16420 [Pseudomonadales bacterium]|nr:hypothetical protein [Pseudomonadales bacterium]